MRSVVYPTACPHCGKSIAQVKPVGERALSAALAILRGACTAPQVSAALGISRGAASVLLLRAEEAGLIKMVDCRGSATGGKTKIYKPAQRMRAFAPAEYRRKAIKDIAA